MRVAWIAFPLHPETPPDGRTLDDLFAGRPINVRDMVRQLRRTADDLGLPFGNRTMTYNSRLAQELSKWAAGKGLEATYGQAVFRAYFADGLNIGDPGTLVDLATGIGLSAGEAERVLRERTYRDAVDQDWALAMQMGVTAVPTFVLNGRAIVGAQPLSVLERFIEEGGVPRKV
jgi:predicted DsbA family dithiol-disulfide isomerase